MPDPYNKALRRGIISATIKPNISMKGNLLSLFSPSSYLAYIGIDWGRFRNEFSLFDSSSCSTESFGIDADPTSMLAFINQLKERFNGGKVAVLTEQSKGALVNLLLDFEFIELFAVNPSTAARFRKSLHSSGTKTDFIDASTLLRMIFTHKDRIIELKRPDYNMHVLEELNKYRRVLVGQRVQIGNRTNSLLADCYPQALHMLSRDIYCPMNLAFLKRWPSYSKLSKAKEKTLIDFYHKHGSRSDKAIEERLQHLRQSSALTENKAIEDICIFELLDCIEQLELLNKQILEIDHKIDELFRSNEEKELFSNLPGAAHAMAPRLLVAFGQDRSRFETVEQFQAYVGIAPIKVQSGKINCTFMRKYCSKFLKQTFHEWAGLSIQKSAWAKAYYQRQKDKGHSANEAKRALAFKWIRILFRCWKDRVPYDEKLYIESLRKHKSPIIDKMIELNISDDEKLCKSA